MRRLLVNVSLVHNMIARISYIYSLTSFIGFTVGNIVKDKDGVITLGTFAELAAKLERQQLTAYNFLRTLYQK